MTRLSMKIESAKQLVQSCSEQMNQRYGGIVFDEWAIVSLVDNKAHLLAYAGPRKKGFLQNFGVDAGTLRAGLMTQNFEPGDFEFARHGVGPAYEAFMALGEGMYLICNNTVQSMDTISSNPRWLGAQVPFVNLSEHFCANPLHAVAAVAC
jgi:hypothetical protein